MIGSTSKETFHQSLKFRKKPVEKKLHFSIHSVKKWRKYKKTEQNSGTTNVKTKDLF